MEEPQVSKASRKVHKCRIQVSRKVYITISSYPHNINTFLYVSLDFLRVQGYVTESRSTTKPPPEPVPLDGPMRTDDDTDSRKRK